LASEKELAETVDSLERAITVLKKNLGFLQTGKMANALGAMASGLQKVVEASWINSHQKNVLQSLLQANAEASDGDEDLVAQPQGSTVSYESQSSGILDTLADMQGKADESLSSTRKDEMEAAHAFAMLKQGLEDEIKVAKKQLSEATQTRSTTEEEQYSAETTLSETEETLAADEKYLEELKQSCSMKATEWAARQKQASEETAAIEKAKEVLSDGVKVFLQTSARLTMKSKIEGDSRSQVVSVLRRISKKVHSYKLMQLVASAQSDPFGKIRGLIEEMLAKLTKAAAEEADQKSFCDEEISESKAKQADLSGKLDKTSARIAKAEADKAKLAEEIKLLETEIAEIDAGQAEATKQRQAENAEYLKASKDFKDSATAVAKAIAVLSEYYNSAAFVQVSAKEAPELGGAKGDVGSTIVSILEVAESDFTTMLAEAEADESSAASAYEKLKQENTVTKATKQADVKGKTSGMKQLEVALGNYAENKGTTSEELDAVLMYLDKLKPQCESKVMSYAERKAKREQEIEGLKEALTILSGEALLQVQSSLRGIRRA
jgi:chromosome segregation ATPase